MDVFYDDPCVMADECGMHPVSSSGAYEAKEPCVFAPLGFQASGLRSMFRSLLPATVMGAAHLRLPSVDADEWIVKTEFFSAKDDEAEHDRRKQW